MILIQKKFDIYRIFSLLSTMTCLTAERIEQYQAELDTLTTQLAAINTAIASGVFYVKSISLDTGEGKQTSVYRNAKEMYEAAEYLQSRIDRLINILNGTGFVNLNLRRKNSG